MYCWIPTSIIYLGAGAAITTASMFMGTTKVLMICFIAGLLFTTIKRFGQYLMGCRAFSMDGKAGKPRCPMRTKILVSFVLILVAFFTGLLSFSSYTQDVSEVVHEEGILQWYGSLVVTIEEAINLMDECPQTASRCFPVSLISFAFDDGYASVIEKAFPILEHHQVPATVFMITDRIGKEEFLSLSNLRVLQGHHWEIASHSVSHPLLTDLDTAKLQIELEQSSVFLKEQGFEVEGFAYPFGRLDGAVIEETARYYNYGRVAYGAYAGINPIPLKPMGPGSKYELKCVVADEHTSIDRIKAYIDEVEIEGGWLILVFHKIENVPREHYVYPTHALTEIVKYLREDLDCCTLREFNDASCRPKRIWSAYTESGREESPSFLGEVFTIFERPFSSLVKGTATFVPRRTYEKGYVFEFRITELQQRFRMERIFLTLINSAGEKHVQEMPIVNNFLEPGCDNIIRILAGQMQSGIYTLNFRIEAEGGQYIGLEGQLFIKIDICPPN